jgi:LPS-assembly protein
VLLQGDVVFREPGILLRGSSARIDGSTSVNRIEAASYVLHDYGAHGQAEAIVYNGETGLVVIENGEFSRCEPESPFWRLRAENITLDQDAARGYARAVSLRVKNVPIFYYPFTLSFPLGDERKSGLLPPSTGSTRSGGTDFELPYYLNLAPNYDATISPRLISDRGVLTKAEIRYLASWSMNTLTMSSLPNDKLYDPATADIIGSDSPTTDDRWFLDYQHRGTLGRNWSTFVDYNAVSDIDYFYDLGSSGLNLTSRTHLNRQGRLNYHSEYLRAGVDVRRIEIIDPLVSEASLSRPYDRLPRLFFDTDTYLPGGFRIGLSGEVTSFDRDLNAALLSPSQLENGALVNGERVNLEPALSWSLESPGWFVRADAKYKHTAYQLTDQATNTLDDPDLGISVYSFDSGLIFEREMARGEGGWRQTLEPRLFYLYSEFEDQSSLPLFDTSEMSFSFNQLFRDDRFSGGDRIADADQVTVALTSRFLDPVGKERARFSVGQIRYFEDRLVSLGNPLQNWPPRYSSSYEKSALAGEFAYSFGTNWQLNADLQWNQDTEEFDEGSFQLRYQRDSNHLLNLAYRFRGVDEFPNFRPPSGIDSRIKQTDISGIWPLNANWKLLARWNYDHSNTRNLETFAGIEYGNCCVTIRLIGREWVDENELFLPNIEPNRGIFVQFTLNGLGNITGGGLSNLLSDGISGFRESDYD